MAAAACTQRTAQCSGVAATSSCRRVTAIPRSRASTVTVRAQADASSRRQLLAAGVALLGAASLGVAPRADAFLGFGEGAQQEEAYKSDTTAILTEVNGALAIAKDDPERDAKISEVRKDINAWVAKYRRDEKKRLERLTKELGDAELLLSRNR